MLWSQPCKYGAMVGVGTVVRVDMFDVHNQPGGFARLQEDVIQTMTEEDAAPGPFDLVGGDVSVLVDFTEGIQPMCADMLNLMRVFGGIEVACDDGRTS